MFGSLSWRRKVLELSMSVYTTGIEPCIFRPERNLRNHPFPQQSVALDLKVQV